MMDAQNGGMQVLTIGPAAPAVTDAVAEIAEKIARDVERHEREEATVQTGGPDGIRTRGLRRDRPAC